MKLFLSCISIEKYNYEEIVCTCDDDDSKKIIFNSNL